MLVKDQTIRTIQGHACLQRNVQKTHIIYLVIHAYSTTPLEKASDKVSMTMHTYLLVCPRKLLLESHHLFLGQFQVLPHFGCLNCMMLSPLGVSCHASLGVETILAL